jgi:hypothetical protein
VRRSGAMPLKKLLIGLQVCIGLSFGLIGCTTLTQESKEEAIQGSSNPPVIEKAFAAKVIRPGDPWMIYLNASDPDGDMSLIIIDFEMPGMPVTPSFLKIREGKKKVLSGYFMIYSSPARDALTGLSAELEVIIEDQAGNRSKTVTFSLEFDYSAKEEKPADGLFENVRLGVIR